MINLKEYITLGKAISYLDLPNDETIRSLRLNSHLTKTLLAYNACPKTDFEYLSQRIILLNAASAYATDELTDLQIKSHIESKYNYLSALKHCYDDGILTRDNTVYDKNAVATFFTDSKSDMPLLYLSNQPVYSKSLNKTFGEYWLETIDPCHRPYIEHYRDLWQKTVKNPEKSPYFLWLEDKIQPNVPDILFLTAVEKQKYQLQIVNGKFRYADENLTTAELQTFVIDDDKNIYLGPNNRRIRHTSFTYGAPVIFAGEARFNNGNLVELANFSGHYMPSEKDMLNAVMYLQQQGCLVKNTEICVFDELKPKRYRFGESDNTLLQTLSTLRNSNIR
ncbi:MAG: hypothetical protein VZR95_06930 [Alphaproteobacteria bacterium]